MPKTLAIIGSAIAGPTLALQILSHPILRSSFRPILFDSSPSPSHSSRAGATVGLFANGLHPLRNLGLEPSIRQQGYECSALSTWRCASDGSTCERLNSQGSAMWSSDLGMGVVYFERWALQRLLVEKVRDLGGEVHWRKKAVEFGSLEDGKTSVSFEDGTDITADVLVGADGGYSSVRRLILEKRDSHTAESRWLPDFMGLTGIYGVSSASESPSSTAPFSHSHLIFLDRGFLSTGPCPDGKTRWDLILPESSPPELNSHGPSPTEVDLQTPSCEPCQSSILPSQYPLSSTISTLHQHLSIPHPYAGPLSALLTSADRIIRTPLRQRVWKQHEIQLGNVILVGDAARLMLPTSGQGTGFAIEDATVLANSLLRHHGSSDGVRVALEEYAREREPRSSRMAKMAALAATWSTSTSLFWRGARYYGSKWQPDRPASKKPGKDPWPFNGRFNVESPPDSS